MYLPYRPQTSEAMESCFSLKKQPEYDKGTEEILGLHLKILE